MNEGLARIRTCLGFAAGALVGLAVPSLSMDVEAQPRQDRPNILFLNADDLGWTDLGFMGSAYYQTPNLDRLATQGMAFTNAYAPGANCSPSRAAVYTGQYAPRTGVYTVGTSSRGEPEFRRLIPTRNTAYIAEENLTFMTLLQQSGYATCHLGKWHIGTDPLPYGYDVNIGGWKAGAPGGRNGYFSPYKNPHLSPGPEGEHLTFRLTGEAIRYLENHDMNQPFFVSLQFYIPHTPIEAISETVEEYEAKRPTPAHSNATYAAMIDHLDTNIGRLMAALDEMGLAENTLVLFTSDNGGLHRVSRQWPLRGEKGSYYEGGIRVPMIVRWPGQVQAGSRSETPVSGIDFFPTFLEAAGVSIPEDKALDGVSLVPLLRRDEPLPERPLFWHFPVYLQAYGPGNVETRDPLFRTRPGTVMRFGRWKLHEYFEDGGLELYDLNKDPGERRHLAELLPEKTAELHAAMKEWREATGAPVPKEPNPRFDAKREAEAIDAFYRRESE